MTFEIEVDGRLQRVTIDSVGAAGPAGGRFSLRLEPVSDGKTDTTPSRQLVLDCRPTDIGLSLVYDDGRVADVATSSQAQGEWLVQLPHIDVAAVVDRRRRSRAHAGGGAATGEQRITAPMPGRIVRVLVKPGDEVKERQGLIVVEAMKMENELTSPKAGRVKDVAVAAGAAVEAGKLLITID